MSHYWNGIYCETVVTQSFKVAFVIFEQHGTNCWTCDENMRGRKKAHLHLCYLEAESDELICINLSKYDDLNVIGIILDMVQLSGHYSLLNTESCCLH